MGKTFHSAKEFRVSLQQRLKNIAVNEGTDVQQIMKKVAFDRFLARLFGDENSSWYLKGGYALELYLTEGRATRDIDLTLNEKSMKGLVKDAKLAVLRDFFFKALKFKVDDYFEFLPSSEGMSLENTPYGGERYDVESRIAGKRFVSFHVDISINEVRREPLYEVLEGGDWLGFLGILPGQFKTMIPEEIFAEKIHAYTLPRDGENSRVRDLLDMYLLLTNKRIDHEKLMDCIGNVFNRRDSHLMPSDLPSPPNSWNDRFPALVEEHNIVVSLEDAFSLVQSFLRKKNK